MKYTATSAVLLIFLSVSCTERRHDHVSSSGPEVINFRALPFSLSDVTLLDGPFKKAAGLDAETLLKYEPDRFLAKFRKEAGLLPRAEHYGGWEENTIAGHSLGHYLSALSMMYQTTGDNRFLDRVNYIVSELKECQDADGTGYIGAIPDGKRILEQEVAKGDIRSQGFDLNGIWVPFYTQHKVMAGLRDAYRLCGNKTALEISEKFADWLLTVVDDLTPEQREEMLHCEHGGITETLADLYADTGNRKYLEMTALFRDNFILGPLSRGEDILPGKHCNTNIPKITGLARIYELTGNEEDKNTAEFFWDRVVRHHSYVTGGNGNNEYFGEPDRLRNRLGDATTETCNVYNMLKLTDHIFEWTGSAGAADYYERALFNHILASQNPVDGRVVYNLSLDMGGYKDFQDPEWFTCCIGSGMENHARYGSSIYFHSDNELYLNQFIASELTWKEKNLTLIQETGYPLDDRIRLEFITGRPEPFTLNIRYPSWAENGVTLMLNGHGIKTGASPGGYIVLHRRWRSGDILEISFPFSLRLESMPDDSNRVAIFYGPLLYAGILGPVDDSTVYEPDYVPVLMTGDRNPADWIVEDEERPGTFVTRGVGRPGDVTLVPFYSVYDKRYSVFWDLFTEREWREQDSARHAEAAHRKILESATVDFLQPGEMQPERDHRLRSERSDPGRFRDRAYRETRNGWFSAEMKVDPDTENSLVAEYWGGFPGRKSFDILADGHIIATENISNRNDGAFLLVGYPIPVELTAGKRAVTIRIEARENSMAGPVFGLRTVKSAGLKGAGL